MKTILKTKKAFTLVEILIVMVILAILAFIAVPKFLESLDVSVGRKAYEAMVSIAAAQQRYANEKGGFNDVSTLYSTTASGLDITFPSATIRTTARTNDTYDFGKFTIQIFTGANFGDASMVGNNRLVSGGLEGYTLTVDFQKDIKRCAVNTTTRTALGRRVCIDLGGTPRSGTLNTATEYNLP
ncbi:prepilin-type N-terminal cleavage/methylation domain-containing protein [Elusimicrobium posterum]|uniref:type IV pilin protein n=1 Tax=Elusimicrobium posterum TaxID=3116653 RepID=UPI003C790D28